MSSTRPAIPLNISAVFAQFAHLSPVTDGRNLHILAPEDATVEVVAGDERPLVAATQLLERLKEINYSLTAALAQPILDQRVVTLYKENSQHEYAFHEAARTAQLTLQALRSAHQPATSANHFQPSAFGLELPTVRSQISSFILSSLERWATEAGLQFFLDPSATDLSMPPLSSIPGISNETYHPEMGKKVTASLSKEHLLVDIEFESHPLAEDKRIDLMQNDALVSLSLLQVKVQNGHKDDSNVPADIHLGGTLQALLEETIRGFLNELGCNSGQSWRSLDVRKAEKAAAKLKAILGELNWIAETVKLETEKNTEKGHEWSDCVSIMAEKAMSILRKEVDALHASRDSSLHEAIPVDLLVLRATALPLPYLLSFSLSFLVYLPPIAYLTALRQFGTAMDASTSSSDQDITDIPLASIRELVSIPEVREGLDVLIATISYEPMLQMPTSLPPAINDEIMVSLDDYSSASIESLLGYKLLTHTSSGTTTGGWVLSFSQGEPGRPLIISQSRMRRIAAAVQLAPNAKDAHDFGLIGLTGSTEAHGPSWLDLAIDPHSTQRSRIYTSRYQPRSNTGDENPDLLNTLMALAEPGLCLGKVPVRTLEEVYAVMLVVKEQIWLQSLLRGVGFRPEYNANYLNDVGMGEAERMMNGMSLGGIQGNLMGVEEAKAMYDTLMNGTYVPNRLRVTYEVLENGQTGVRMTFPLGAIPVVTDITLDATLPKGVKVTVNGQRVERLEETTRRGGLLGLVIAVRKFVSG